MDGLAGILRLTQLAPYAIAGDFAATRETVDALIDSGFSFTQLLEAASVCFVQVGPRGMETLAAVLNEVESRAQSSAASPVFPSSWDQRRTTLDSGLDFSTPELSNAECTLLLGWYESTLGEVPSYVRLLLTYRPALLKAYRNRIENALHELPAQLLPLMFLSYDLSRGFAEGVREDLLLARALGVEPDIVQRTIASVLVFTGPAGAGLVREAAGDLIGA